MIGHFPAWTRRPIAWILIVILLGGLIYRLAHDRTVITKYLDGFVAEESQR